MTTFPSFEHIAWILFLGVLANQAGAPVPVSPPLLVAGALARSHVELLAIVVVVAGAALCADVLWYGVGRWRGAEALSLLRKRSHWLSSRIDRVAKLSGMRRATLLLSAIPA